MEFNEALRQFRQRKEATQKEMASAIGISEKQYWQYEKGIHEMPIRYLIAICDAYECSADEVLGRIECEKEIE